MDVLFLIPEEGCLVVPAPLVSILVYHRILYSIDISLADYMVYTRGSSEDFDRYAAVTGDSGWSWGNMKQFMAKVSQGFLSFVHPSSC